MREKLQGAVHAEGSRPDQMRKEGGERGEGKRRVACNGQGQADRYPSNRHHSTVRKSCSLTGHVDQVRERVKIIWRLSLKNSCISGIIILYHSLNDLFR